MSELTKCPGIPTLYPKQSYRLTGEYLLLQITEVIDEEEIGHHIAWVEDEAGVIGPMALWNCLGNQMSNKGLFITPRTSSNLFPPVMMIKEPFVHDTGSGCAGIWVLHWTSDRVWVGRHADCMPERWRRGPEPGNEADFWIEKAKEIVETGLPRLLRTEETLLQDVLWYVVACEWFSTETANPRHSIDQALQFDLSNTCEDGEELWFQFTKTRAHRLALLEFEEEALFGLLQSWPPNRFIYICIRHVM